MKRKRKRMDLGIPIGVHIGGSHIGGSHIGGNHIGGNRIGIMVLSMAIILMVIILALLPTMAIILIRIHIHIHIRIRILPRLCLHFVVAVPLRHHHLHHLEVTIQRIQHQRDVLLLPLQDHLVVLLRLLRQQRAVLPHHQRLSGVLHHLHMAAHQRALQGIHLQENPESLPAIVL
jgi:hypothetical protein